MVDKPKKNGAIKPQVKRIARKTYAGRLSLRSTHPDIAAEALGWDAANVTAGSPEERTWKCNLGHVYQAAIVRRARRNHGCPFCSGHQVWFGFNDLATTHPQLSMEAVDGPVTGYSAGSQVRLNWKCDKEHIYSAKIAKRVSGTKCPFCASGGKRKISPGFNDLATTHPLLAAEAYGWDATKKSKGQQTVVKWKCAEGHIWKAKIVKRVQGTGCPSCDNTGYDPNLKGYLYLLSHELWNLYKIGISNSQERRTDEHQTRGWEVVDVRGPMDGLLAYEWEQSILKMLKKRGAELGRNDIAGRFDGYTEAWKKSSYEVTTITQLMRDVVQEEEHES